MNLDIEKLIGLIATISAGSVAFGKYVMPIIAQWLGIKNKEKEMWDRLTTLETNHIVHLEADIKEIKDEQVRQGNRITRIEAKIEK